MAERDDEPSPKVRHLFPDKAREHDQSAQRQDEIRALLHAAEPEPGPEPDQAQRPTQDSVPALQAVSDDGPPADHRNAVQCPQCDHWTWKATQHCWRCGFDLWMFAEQTERERQKRLREERRATLAGTAWWLLIGGVLAMSGASNLPSVISGWVSGAGFIALLGSVIYFKAAEKL